MDQREKAGRLILSCIQAVNLYVPRFSKEKVSGLLPAPIVIVLGPPHTVHGTLNRRATVGDPNTSSATKSSGQEVTVRYHSDTRRSMPGPRREGSFLAPSLC